MNIYDLALSFTSGLGLNGAHHLLDVFGSAEAVFRASREELVGRAALNSKAVVDAITSQSGMRGAEAEWRYIERHHITPLALTDDAYPHVLRECPDAPTVLYTMGNIEALHRPSVAFVGTRHMSAYGQRIAAKIIGQLKELKPEISIVSGLALGNDGNAHRVALDCGAATVGVIANALPDVAPATNQPLADRILQSGGAIITEISSQHKNTGKFFPSRNRIIAGLASGTVVVESPYKGGSLITADNAFDYGRVVMAIPGRADDKTSYGSNLLIKHNKAAMVCSAGDIIHELGWDVEVVNSASFVPSDDSVEVINVSDDERKVLDAMCAGEVVDYDVLAERCGLSVGVLSALLVSLELCGLVRLLPGKRCEKV